jgi:hypothetical protein
MWQAPTVTVVVDDVGFAVILGVVVVVVDALVSTALGSFHYSPWRLTFGQYFGWPISLKMVNLAMHRHWQKLPTRIQEESMIEEWWWRQELMGVA